MHQCRIHSCSISVRVCALESSSCAWDLFRFKFMFLSALSAKYHGKRMEMSSKSSLDGSNGTRLLVWVVQAMWWRLITDGYRWMLHRQRKTRKLGYLIERDLYSRRVAYYHLKVSPLPSASLGHVYYWKEGGKTYFCEIPYCNSFGMHIYIFLCQDC